MGRQACISSCVATATAVNTSWFWPESARSISSARARFSGLPKYVLSAPLPCPPLIRGAPVACVLKAGPVRFQPLPPQCAWYSQPEPHLAARFHPYPRPAAQPRAAIRFRNSLRSASTTHAGVDFVKQDKFYFWIESSRKCQSIVNNPDLSVSRKCLGRT